MPKSRPAASGYARLAQADDDEDALSIGSGDDDPHRGQRSLSTNSQYASIQPKSHSRMPSGMGSPGSRSRKRSRPRRNSTVDIKAINARLERWADEIAQKFKIRRIKGKTEEEEQLEIHHSVFQAPDWIRPATTEVLMSEYGDRLVDRVTKLDFDDLVESVRVAIDRGIHPKLISQGSSGSYFAQNSHGKVLGVFKPKDEEPYASRNPKWTKWIHRNLFPFFFGRACLIPNLSYVSEAAACVLDQQLRTNLVPYTDIVSLSSQSFHYDFWDRRAYYRKGKPLPEKVGSFQAFLRGYKDANLFLKQHPWPDQHNASLRQEASKRRKKRRWAEECRPGGAESDDEDETTRPNTADETNRRQQFWSESLMQSFREQLEKLVILDYIMRNTDRGLDNWMIKVNEDTQQATIVAEPPKADALSKVDSEENGLVPEIEPYKRQERMMASSRSATPSSAHSTATASVGAIDNSLSWPWKHPDAWRSYPFGWLFLPVSLIGQPFSEATRRHFLPLLTSKQWWSETQLALRRCFRQDADFKERMFARQMAVMKGQAWNVVEALKTSGHGPLELTRRSRVCVWDDLVDIPIAVPLQIPSSEMRRRPGEMSMPTQSPEEMDISTAHATNSLSQRDLLGSHSPSDLGADNRFNLSRQLEAAEGARESEESNRSALSAANARKLSPHKGPTQSRDASRRPNVVAFKPSVSYDEPRLSPEPPQSQRRHFSFTTLRRSHNQAYGDDDEGDLGYAAAEDMEDNMKKVIVERLEAVKSKNPVFTWC